MTELAAMFRRELALRWRGGGWAASVGLFTLAAVLAPLSIGRDTAVLAAAGPAILWLSACLSLLIGLDGLYDDDLKNGGFEVYRLSPAPFALTMAVKMLAGWIAACLPLCLVAPILLWMFGLPHPFWGGMGFLLGTPGLAFTAGAMGALCAGLRRGTALIVFLSLPLFAPALVFGAATMGDRALTGLLVLTLYSLQAIALCPLIASAAIKSHME